MQQKQMVSALILICGIFFAVFIKGYHSYSYDHATEQLGKHATIIAGSLWNFEQNTPKAYLTLAADSSNYEHVLVTDSSGDTFLDVRIEPTSQLQEFLVALRLIPTYQLQSEILFGERSIGTIKVTWRFTGLYTYIYLLICLILAQLVVILFLRLYDANRSLEVRVAERTEELAGANVELRQSEENLSITLNSIGDAVIATDTQGLITRMNPVAETLTGWTEHEARQRPIRDVLHLINAHTHRAIPDPATRALRENQPVTLESHTLMQARDGRELHIADSCSLIMDARQQTVGAVLVFRDITSQYRVEAERRRLAAILENTSDMVSLSYPDERIYYLNRAGYAMLGWSTKDDLDTFRMKDIHPEWAYEMLHNHAIPAAVKYGSWEGETAIIGDDGHEVPVSQVLVSHHSANGELEFISTVIRDITEIRQFQDTLKQSRAELRKIIDLVPSMIYVRDIEGRLLLVNEALSRQLNLPIEKLTDQLFGDIYSGDATQMLASDQQVIERSEALPLTEEVFSAADGRQLLLQTTKIPFQAIGSDQPAILGISTDITERKKAQEMMIQTEKMMSVGGLAAGMAHEINNPLAGILQNIQVITNRLNPELKKNAEIANACGFDLQKCDCYMEERGLKKMLRSIEDNGRRAAKIVENMLSFSRKSSEIPEPQDIELLLENTLELASNDYDLKRQYDFRHIRIVRDYDQNLPPVPCEASKIQQVLLNLLKNGAQAMLNDNNGMPTFSLSLKRESGMIRIEIADNGPGMPEEVRRRIFEPFFTTKGNQGTGLGLSVSFFIITDNHNGTMEVESEPGVGTKFIIRLPMA